MLTCAQLIELWETFLVQLDAEDDEQPYYKPSVAPLPSDHSAERPSGETKADSTASATATDEE